MMANYDFLLVDEWEDISGSCNCPIAPQKFLIPPPPPPPAMGVCGGIPLGDPAGGQSGGYFCHLEPMGAEFTQASFPSLPVIAVCSSVILVAVLVACFLIWRHKTKVQNMLPSKQDVHHLQQGEQFSNSTCLIYEDVLINQHPTLIPVEPGTASTVTGSTALVPIELLDVKLADIIMPDAAAFSQAAFCPIRDATSAGKPYQHPVYEEILWEHPKKPISSKNGNSAIDGHGGGQSFPSEDEFAEDEISGLGYPSGECSSQHCSATSSVQGSTGGDLCKDPVSSDEGTTDDCEYPDQRIPGLFTGDRAFTISDHKQTCRPSSGSKGFCPSDASAGVEPMKLFLQPPRGESLSLWYSPPACPKAASVENIYSTIDDGDDISIFQPPVATYRQSPNALTCSEKCNANRIKFPVQTSNEENESYGDIMPDYNKASYTS